MKQIIFILVLCFVLASSYPIRKDSNAIRKLKQTVKTSNTNKESTKKARVVSTGSIFPSLPAVKTAPVIRPGATAQTECFALGNTLRRLCFEELRC
eukprot:g3735.t2